MKRTFALLLVLYVAVGLAACTKPVPQDPTVPTTTPTTAPTIPLVPTSYEFKLCWESGTKEGVPEFWTLLKEQMPNINDDHYGIDHCYNITTPEVAAETELQMFIAGAGYTFIVCDGVIRMVDSYGHGIFKVIPCDINGDGKKGLLMVYGWGSGSTHYRIAVFDPASKEVTEIPRTWNAYLSYHFPWVTASGADVYFEGKTEADNQIMFPILRLEGVYQSGKLVEYVATGIDGNIVYQDGTYKFIPYEK